MIGACKRLLLENADAWGLPGSGEWTFFFHNNYHPHHSNINLLWFHRKSRFPQAVTKIFREAQIPHREFDNLRQAYRCAPRWVPRPLDCAPCAGFWMLWLGGVPGVRLFRYSPALLRSMAGAVGDMHCAIRNGGFAPLRNRYCRLVTEPLDTLAAYGEATSVREGCAALAAKASAEWLASFPAIPQHGDLFVDNLLWDRQLWHVVDWESFGAIDLPFYDLFTLLLSALGVGGATPDQWSIPLARCLPSLVADYAARLDLRAAEVPVVLPLALANWFHLQWLDGRKEFCARMYKTIQHYFDCESEWSRAFSG